MNLLKELREKECIKLNLSTNVHCKVFEDNSGAIEMVRVPKMRPRTKHINLVYHWFLDYVKQKQIKIYPISTEEQIADMYTKPLPAKSFIKHRKKSLHW